MKITNKAIHFHTIPIETMRECANHDYVILGGVLCKLTYAHNNIPQLEETCTKIKSTYNKRVYIQQPFYLEEDWGKFLKLINDFNNKKLIDGVIVNSFGILKYIKDLDIEIVMSRFSIGKRKKINSYFCELLRSNNVRVLELFSDDHELIKEVIKLTNLIIWVRFNDAILNNFSNTCFINNYLKKCIDDPEQCVKGKYKLSPKNISYNDSELILSGHFIYIEDKMKTIEVSINQYDTIVYNAYGLEI